MQISLRSQLIAGTTAIVGASAIAMTPVTGAHLSLPSMQVPSSAQVAMAAFSSPLAQLSLTTLLASTYLFNGDANPLDASIWAYSGFPGSGAGEQGGLPVLPAGLQLSEAGGYSSVGLIPQIIDDALPIISQLGYNGSEYLNATATSVALAGVQLGEGITGAIEDLLSLDIAGALESVVTAISQVGSTLLNAGGFVLTGVVNRLAAVLETTVELVPVLLGATLNQLGAVAASVGAVVTNFVDAFSAPNPIEGAWNALVDGLLGPSGIPGTLVNLTIGAGVQTAPITDLADLEANFAPSIRTEIQGGVKVIADALATPVVTSAAAVSAPAAAAAVAEVEAPAAVEVAEVEAPAAVAEVEAPAAVEVAEVEAPAAVEVAEVEVPAAVEAAEVEAPAAVTAPKAAASDNSRATAGTPKRASRGAAERASASSSAE